MCLEFPPPPSPTFHVAPGGVAIIAKEPWVVRSLKVPTLQKWVTTARLALATLLGPDAPNIILVTVYGYPEGHEFSGLNEEMLRDPIW